MLELIIDLYNSSVTREYAWELTRIFGVFLNQLNSAEQEKARMRADIFKYEEKITEAKRMIRDLESKNAISEQILSNLKYPDTF